MRESVGRSGVHCQVQPELLRTVRRARVLARSTIRRATVTYAKNNIAGRISLKCPDPGSGRKIPVILHGAGVYHDIFYRRNLVLNPVQFSLRFYY